MAALNPQTLFASGNCYACFGVSQNDLLTLSLWDTISQNAGGSVSYDGVLVYTQLDGTTTTVANPVGAFNLTFAGNPVTAIHCHNCPLITSITCTSDALLTVVDLVSCAALSNLVFSNCTALASLNLSTFVNMSQILVNGCSSLASLTLTALQTIAGTVNLTGTVVTSFNAPALTACQDIQAAIASLTTLSAPLLNFVNGTLTFSNCKFATFNLNSLDTVIGSILMNSNTALTAASFPVWTGGGGSLNISSCPLLTSISAPMLGSLQGDVDFHSDPLLASVNLNSLESTNSNSFFGSGCTSLPSLSLPSFLEDIFTVYDFLGCTVLVNFSFPNNIQDGAIVSFRNCALNQPSVDALMLAGVNGGMASGNIYTDGGTSSPPSAAGIVNKNIMIGAGADIQTN